MLKWMHNSVRRPVLFSFWPDTPPASWLHVMPYRDTHRAGPASPPKGCHMRSLTAVSVLLVCLHAPAARAQTHELRLCQTEAATKACNACARTGLSATFRINKTANSVLVNWYDSGRYSQSATLENCNIIDTKNWVCTSRVSGIALTRDEMFENTYRSYNMRTADLTCVGCACGVPK